MDAISLLTNLEAEKASAIMREIMIKSSITFENIDVHELGIYLRKNLSPEYIKATNYEDILPFNEKESKKDKEAREDADLYDFVEAIENMFDENELIENEETLVMLDDEMMNDENE